MIMYDIIAYIITKKIPFCLGHLFSRSFLGGFSETILSVKNSMLEVPPKVSENLRRHQSWGVPAYPGLGEVRLNLHGEGILRGFFRGDSSSFL